MIKLDARLQAAADLVLPGLPMADIGTDHAYLPIYLLKKGICPRVIAADKAAAPIRSAKGIAEVHHCGKEISLRCGDGLSVLSPGEVDTIAICGMGGQLMIEILQAGDDVLRKTKRLILQPQKHIHLLRLWLEENHWRIVAESLVESKGFFYAVLAAEPGEMRLRPLEAEFGPLLIRQRSAAFLAWLERERIEREELCLSLQKQETAAAVARCRELQEELCRLRSLINGEEFYEPESLI